MTTATKNNVDLIDRVSLHHYLSFKHVPQPMSILKGRTRETISVRCPKFSPPLDMSEAEIIDEMERILVKTTDRLLTNETNILCSGGVDSGLVTAIASNIISSKKIRTHNINYDTDNTEGKTKDRIYSRMISKKYNTEHNEYLMNFAEISENLTKILSVIGEPFSGYISPWFIGRAMHERGITRVLTGDWGDELFGSYAAHRDAYVYPDIEPWMIREKSFVFNEAEKGLLYKDGYWPGVSSFEYIKRYFKNLTATDSLNKMLESEYLSWYPDQTYLSFYVLTRCWNVESVSPYADPEFADFAARIPASIKMRNGEPKYILKKLAERYLPYEIVYRQKEGFVTPTMSMCVSLEPWVRENIDTPVMRKLFNFDFVKGLVDNFYANPSDKGSYKLWNLVSLSVYLSKTLQM